MRKLSLLFPLFFLFTSCGSNQKEVTWAPAPPSPSPLDRKVAGGVQELPITAPVNPKNLDLCTRHLLFADQYITASDYPDAEDEIKQAQKYCSPDDPKLLYMEAVVADINEKDSKAYKLYYRAAKGYIKKGDMDSAFKCYSGMLSINPNGKEVKELKHYFEDDNY